MAARRSRPDAARLAGDPLLLRAYDLRLVGPGGEVLAEEPRAVEARFEAGGFFGLASAAARRVGSVGCEGVKGCCVVGGCRGLRDVREWVG